MIKHVQQKQNHQKDMYDRGVRGSPYSVGDLVLLHSPEEASRGNCTNHGRGLIWW